MENIKMKYLKTLKDAIINEDFFETEELLGIIEDEEQNDVLDYIREILIIIEENPDIDLGNPGPIGYFFEEYYKSGYELLLLKSIENKPTIYTISLLNALLNDSFLKNRDKYLDALRNTINRNDVSETVRKQAEELYLFQKENSY